ncbi:hypothetical protein SAMN02745150_00557 [Brevinema andersonii]|uniref:Uncharacterized protein n=1 Tax=Brevinema andersonii TaxID=34097 RepID=A0A1I1DI53_BREAD|nr:hypothetical protein [Brevinema andersonii]SFB74547.1 hypothetical protein SAMN02745150_00557 [Brevinema andersonii]
MAIELGTAINDRLMKVGIGDSPEAAQNALNLHVIWNYMDKEMAIANDRVIEEAIKRRSNIWISYRDNMIDDSDPNPSYSSANTTNALFIRGNKTIKMQYVATQNGITETLEFIYDYTMIEDESTTKGVLRLSGYGEFADMFMAGELGSGVKQNRAQIAFGTDTEKSKQALEQLKSSGKWNLFEHKSLLIGHQVLTTLVAQHKTKDSVVKVTGGTGIFDVYGEKNTKKYTFDTSQTDPTVTVETIVTGVVASHTHTVEMTQDRSSTEGTFQLINSGSPDHSKYFGIKIDNDNTHLFSDNDLDVVTGYFTSDMPEADHRYENNIKKSDWREI